MSSPFSKIAEGERVLNIKPSKKINVIEEISELSSFFKSPPQNEELS